MCRACAVFLAVICLAVSAGQSGSAAARKTAHLKVSAGPFDRRGTVVSFVLPEGLKAKPYGLRDGSGRTVPLQVEDGRNATFVLPDLKAGATARYRLVELKSGGASSQGVELRREGKRLAVSAGGRRVLDFRTEGELPGADVKPVFLRGGYIHPVYTPSGVVVTDDHPSDHYHHHGIWAAWTKTEFEGRHPDFWNVHDGTGRVEFVALDDTWGGAVHGGFRSRQRYVDLSGPAPKVALNESWEVRVYRTAEGLSPYFVFDLISTQECATQSPLVLQEYRYGGLGVRGHREWKDKGKVSFLTSEGKDRSNGNATRARWCHIGGPVGGRQVGIAILDHPGNFRAPQPMRINPDDPFFNYAPSQLGPFEITPGSQYISRYRFVVYDGQPDRAELDRLWNDYADPPRVTVTFE